MKKDVYLVWLLPSPCSFLANNKSYLLNYRGKKYLLCSPNNDDNFRCISKARFDTQLNPLSRKYFPQRSEQRKDTDRHRHHHHLSLGKKKYMVKNKKADLNAYLKAELPRTVLTRFLGGDWSCDMKNYSRAVSAVIPVLGRNKADACRRPTASVNLEQTAWIVENEAKNWDGQPLNKAGSQKIPRDFSPLPSLPSFLPSYPRGGGERKIGGGRLFSNGLVLTGFLVAVDVFATRDEKNTVQFFVLRGYVGDAFILISTNNLVGEGGDRPALGDTQESE